MVNFGLRSNVSIKGASVASFYRRFAAPSFSAAGRLATAFATPGPIGHLVATPADETELLP
jgi:hypothetical protein